MNDERWMGEARKPRVWLWLSGAAVLLFLALAVSLGVWQARQEAEVAREIAAIASTGAPLSPSEMEAFYATPPTGEDMTRLWLDGIAPFSQQAFGQAAQALQIVGNQEGPIPPPGEPWAELELAERLLGQYQSSLSLLHQAAAGGGAARFPTSFKNGFAMLLPHAQNMRAASRVLVLEAHVRAHRGDAYGAAESIEAALSVGRSLENEPILVSQLVRLACDWNARSHFLKLLPHVPFAEEDLVRLQDKLAATEYRTGLRRALIGERALGSMALSDPKQLRMTGGMPQGADFFVPLLSGGAQQIYLDRMQRVLVAADLPWPQAIGEVDSVEREAAADTEAAAIFSRLKFTLSGMVAPAVETAFKAVARHTAANDAAIAAIGIERYRRQHGEFPAQLGQLVPDLMKTVPLDPFNGQPLKYVAGENGYILYNVGEDGIDNGGQGDETGKPDDVLRMEYPANNHDESELP